MSRSAEEWSLDRGAGICSALRDRAALEARVRVLRVRWVFLFLVPLLEWRSGTTGVHKCGRDREAHVNTLMRTWEVFAGRLGRCDAMWRARFR